MHPGISLDPLVEGHSPASRYPPVEKNRIIDVKEKDLRGRARHLTALERAILAEIVAEHSVQEIAVIFSLSEKRVEDHRQRLMQKLGARGPVELVQIALQERLV
jgi:DNA-binding CsgD family transcriptional regulator